MKTRTTIEIDGEPCQHVEDDERRLSYTFTIIAAPLQVEGTIQGTPFYFRARGDRYRFAVSEDENISPVAMKAGDPGFYTSVDLPDADCLSFDEAEDVIERLTDQYLRERKT